MLSKSDVQRVLSFSLVGFASGCTTESLPDSQPFASGDPINTADESVSLDSVPLPELVEFNSFTLSPIKSTETLFTQSGSPVNQNSSSLKGTEQDLLSPNEVIEHFKEKIIALVEDSTTNDWRMRTEAFTSFGPINNEGVTLEYAIDGGGFLKIFGFTSRTSTKPKDESGQTYEHYSVEIEGPTRTTYSEVLSNNPVFRDTELGEKIFRQALTKGLERLILRRRAANEFRDEVLGELAETKGVGWTRSTTSIDDTPVFRYVGKGEESYPLMLKRYNGPKDVLFGETIGEEHNYVSVLLVDSLRSSLYSAPSGLGSSVLNETLRYDDEKAKEAFLKLEELYQSGTSEIKSREESVVSLLTLEGGF